MTLLQDWTSRELCFDSYPSNFLTSVEHPLCHIEENIVDLWIVAFGPKLLKIFRIIPLFFPIYWFILSILFAHISTYGHFHWISTVDFVSEVQFYLGELKQWLAMRQEFAPHNWRHFLPAAKIWSCLIINIMQNSPQTLLFKALSQTSLLEPPKIHLFTVWWDCKYLFSIAFLVFLVACNCISTEKLCPIAEECSEVHPIQSQAQ